MVASTFATSSIFVEDYGPRDGTPIDRIQIHHGAATSLSVMLDLQRPGGRTVSSNYVVKDGDLVSCVPEQHRAFTSGSGIDDRRAITFEIANESADGWTVSDETMHTVARVMADIATRYGFSLNDETVITHQEIYQRFGRSYPTACPGDLQRRKGELIDLAKQYQASDLGGDRWDEMASKDEIKQAMIDVIQETRFGPGSRNLFETLRFIADMTASVPERVWDADLPAQDESGKPILKNGKPVKFKAWGFLTSVWAWVDVQRKRSAAK